MCVCADGGGGGGPLHPFGEVGLHKNGVTFCRRGVAGRVV